MTDEDEAARRFFATTPVRVLVAIRRRKSLARCRRYREMLISVSPGGVSDKDLMLFIKHEQRILVTLRRFRETGIWPTEH